jgi:hypothetical protein
MTKVAFHLRRDQPDYLEESASGITNSLVYHEEYYLSLDSFFRKDLALPNTISAGPTNMPQDSAYNFAMLWRKVAALLVETSQANFREERPS